MLPTAFSADIVLTVNVARSSTSQLGTRVLNAPTAESDTNRRRYRMLNRSAYVDVQIQLHVTSLLPLWPFPYFGSAHQIFNIHILQLCAFSIFTPFSFVSVTSAVTPEAVECRILDRENPVTNPLTYNDAVDGDKLWLCYATTKQNPYTCTWQ